jgi:hypothetical protein
MASQNFHQKLSLHFSIEKQKTGKKTYCALIIMPPGKTEIDHDILEMGEEI